MCSYGLDAVDLRFNDSDAALVFRLRIFSNVLPDSREPQLVWPNLGMRFKRLSVDVENIIFVTILASSLKAYAEAPELPRFRCLTVNCERCSTGKAVSDGRTGWTSVTQQTQWSRISRRPLRSHCNLGQVQTKDWLDEWQRSRGIGFVDRKVVATGSCSAPEVAADETDAQARGEQNYVVQSVADRRVGIAFRARDGER